jgi:hypothetical protein
MKGQGQEASKASPSNTPDAPGRSYLPREESRLLILVAEPGVLKKLLESGAVGGEHCQHPLDDELWKAKGDIPISTPILRNTRYDGPLTENDYTK